MEVDQEIQQLEQQLRQTVAAERFLEFESGRLIVELFTKEITRLVRDITSDKYRKDFAGYNNALSDLRAYQNILKKIQVAGSPQRREKIKERLEDIKETEKNA